MAPPYRESGTPDGNTPKQCPPAPRKPPRNIALPTPRTFHQYCEARLDELLAKRNRLYQALENVDMETNEARVIQNELVEVLQFIDAISALTGWTINY